MGRFEFVTHCVMNSNDFPAFNSAIDVFTPLNSKEYYRTVGFKEIAYIYGDTEQSYRKTSERINRTRWQQKEGTPYRTLQESTEREGTALLDYIFERTKRILKANNFSESGDYLGSNETYSDKKTVEIDAVRVREAAEKVSNQYDPEEMLKNPVGYESPKKTVNVSIDDVNVKKQEELRPKRTEPKETKRKYVHNTIAHVEKGGEAYTLSGYGIKFVLMNLLAFLFENDLVGNRFQFFTDGHTTLNLVILRVFVWYGNIGIILDWYHLEKKCRQQLSMALKGSKIRNQILGELMPILWHGLTGNAIKLLLEMDETLIKNNDVMQKLILYLERNRLNIPCYAIRKDLGLRNGSSIGEKMNDLIVSGRQKHNGMSWSQEGSVALAAITCLKRNNEYGKWFETEEIDFKLAA